MDASDLIVVALVVGGRLLIPLSLIVTLYNRYRPEYLARFPREPIATT